MGWGELLALIVFQRGSLEWFPIVGGLAMALVCYSGQPMQHRLVALLSSLVARRWVGLRALWWFRLRDLSIDEMVGAWCFGCLTGPPGFACWVSFCPGVRFCLLLSPCLCFVSLLYLDLCVLGDDALVGWGSFVRAGCLCVLVRVWVGGGIGAFGPVWAIRWCVFCWPFRGGASFVDLLCFFSSFVCCVFVRVCLCVLCGRLLGGGGGAGLLALVCGVWLWVCRFLIGCCVSV